MGLEFELKYKADAAVQQRILEDLGPWQECAMATTYYDTPSGSLSARHYTLRCRMENQVPVCTVKTPAGDLARGEWELSGEADIRRAIPVLCEMGAPADLEELTQEGVLPICGARFLRKTTLLEVGDTLLELAVDQGILFAGEREIPLCEVEVELKAGGMETAAAWASILARRYGLEPEPLSKFKRASMLRGNNHAG